MEYLILEHQKILVSVLRPVTGKATGYIQEIAQKRDLG